METIQEIRAGFGRPNVKLVAVSKTKPVDAILEVYGQGQRIFGENRALELEEKAQILPKDISWHMIGHLQRNKVRNVAPYVDMIHSIDSIRLASEVNRQAKRIGRVIPCLLQIRIAKEETKYGFDLEELMDWLAAGQWKEMDHIEFAGVMGMASFVPDMGVVREEFRYLKQCFDKLKSDIFTAYQPFCEISMGMSGDYPVAIEEGSTIVRIGTLIFGERNVP
jgi:pyridoxal phosphate enzyme (YggS family)